MWAYSKEYFQKKIKNNETLQTIKKVLKNKYNSKTKSLQLI